MASKRHLYFRNERSDIVRFLPREYHTVLEVGCGEGNFRRNLPHDCEVWGCEPNSQAAEVSAEKLARVLVGRFDETADRLPDGYFDLVVCNDVIEHMVDHDWFLEQARRKLTTNGVLVGSIPNVRYVRNLYNLLVKKDWEYRDRLTLDRTHLRFFTEKSLRRTLTAHGFTIEELQGINATERMAARVLISIVNACTFWHHSDIKFLQFAFRARKA